MSEYELSEFTNWFDPVPVSEGRVRLGPRGELIELPDRSAEDLARELDGEPQGTPAKVGAEEQPKPSGSPLREGRAPLYYGSNPATVRRNVAILLNRGYKLDVAEQVARQLAGLTPPSKQPAGSGTTSTARSSEMQNQIAFRPNGAVFVYEEVGQAGQGAQLAEQRRLDAPRQQTGEELEGRARYAFAFGTTLDLPDGRTVRILGERV